MHMFVSVTIGCNHGSALVKACCTPLGEHSAATGCEVTCTIVIAKTIYQGTMHELACAIAHWKVAMGNLHLQPITQVQNFLHAHQPSMFDTTLILNAA